MLKLYANDNVPLSSVSLGGMKVLRVTKNKNFPFALRSTSCLLTDEPPNEAIQSGFAAYLTRALGHLDSDLFRNVFRLSPELSHLDEGDVVRLSDVGYASVIYRRKANMNAFLVTERCNSFCVMCSQPPRDVNDSYLIDQYLEALPLIDRGVTELGITGGEPTLLGARFFEFVQAIKAYHPTTSLHILSNGRNFKDPKLARRLAGIRHADVMLGIPLYSDISSIHDFVVQADGAFDETIAGILNLKQYRVPVEIRVVVHRYTAERLENLASFIVRNLQFVDHVALMGLEPMGFGKTNFKALWIDPMEYGNALADAVRILDRAGIRTSIYNHQYCVVPDETRRFLVKSISDWKNEYIDKCQGCVAKGSCGGFFSSALERHSVGIKPILE